MDSALVWLIDKYWEQEDFARTAELETQLLQSRRRTLGEEDLAIPNTAFNLSITLTYLDRLEEAAQLAEEVLEKYRRLLGEDHEKTRKAILLLNRLLES